MRSLHKLLERIPGDRSQSVRGKTIRTQAWNILEKFQDYFRVEYSFNVDISQTICILASHFCGGSEKLNDFFISMNDIGNPYCFLYT